MDRSTENKEKNGQGVREEWIVGGNLPLNPSATARYFVGANPYRYHIEAHV